MCRRSVLVDTLVAWSSVPDFRDGKPVAPEATTEIPIGPAQVEGPSAIEETPGFTWLFGPCPGTTLLRCRSSLIGGGEYRQNWRLIDLNGLLPLDFTLMYAPDLYEKSPAIGGRTQFPFNNLVSSFTSNTVIRIVEFEEQRVTPYKIYANVFMGGDSILFEKDDLGNFTVVGPIKYELRRVGDFYFFMDPIRELVYIFRTRYMNYGWWEGSGVIQVIIWVGEVVRVVDRNGNSLTYTYNADILPTHIEEAWDGS